MIDTMADGAFVPDGTVLEEGDLTAKEEFFHIIQFLFLVGRDTLKGAYINIPTTVWVEALAWPHHKEQVLPIRMYAT